MDQKQQADTIKGLIIGSGLSHDIGDQIVSLIKIKIKSNNSDDEAIAVWFETLLRLFQQLSDHLG
jgi:predicted transcriptional regulator